MLQETSADDLVQQLRRVGVRPPEKLVEQIVAHGAAAREPLLGLATDAALFQEEEPVCWGPLHALRLLGEIPDPEMIAPLLEVLPITIYDEEDQPPTFWAKDVLQIIGRCGPAAYALLWNWIDEEAHNDSSRGAALQALAYITVIDPDKREPLITEAQARLPVEQSPAIMAGLISILAELGVADSYAEVMAAYRAGRVDRAIFPPGIARQLLLGGGQPTLSQVQTSLWDRYDQEGPFLLND